MNIQVTWSPRELLDKLYFISKINHGLSTVTVETHILPIMHFSSLKGNHTGNRFGRNPIPTKDPKGLKLKTFFYYYTVFTPFFILDNVYGA